MKFSIWEILHSGKGYTVADSADDLILSENGEFYENKSNKAILPNKARTI